MTKLFNEDKCEQRNRIAALRDNVDAAPVKLFKSGSVDAGLVPPKGWEGRLCYSDGSLPTGIDEALFKINLSVIGGTGKELLASDVYIHFLEAANGNFIGDRFMFLDASTLKNIANHAESGFSFMNSHRTGGLSAPSELPFGRTFAGRYEEYEKDDKTFKRSILGIYMIKGQRPNGTAGPSTDDLHSGIDGGTITDVSMGLVGGTRLCDVCGIDLSERDTKTGKYLCPHAPGTHREMTEEQIAAQHARNVAGGKASYSLVDSVPQEVSAVYKGAVPGAGFRKVLDLGKNQQLGEYKSEVLLAYGSLMGGQHRNLFESKKMDIFRAFRFWQAAGEPAEIDLSSLAGLDDSGNSVHKSAQVEPKIPSARLDELKSREDAVKLQEQELLSKLEGIKVSEFSLEADKWIAPLQSAGKLTVSEVSSVKLGFILASLDDMRNPATNPATGEKVSRLETFKSSHAGRTPNLLTEEVTKDATVLSELDSSSNSDKPTAERLAALLKLTNLGKQVAEELAKKN